MNAFLLHFVLLQMLHIIMASLSLPLAPHSSVTFAIDAFFYVGMKLKLAALCKFVKRWWQTSNRNFPGSPQWGGGAISRAFNPQANGTAARTQTLIPAWLASRAFPLFLFNETTTGVRPGAALNFEPQGDLPCDVRSRVVEFRCNIQKSLLICGKSSIRSGLCGIRRVLLVR